VSGFDDFLIYLDDSPFEEVPVDIDTFVEDDRYLGSRKMKLSPIQRECLLKMTQIYKPETLAVFMESEEKARHFHRQYTMNEIILMLGKGSGKDEMSAMAICYIVYKLLCLKDPAAYYGKPAGDNIDILNIAVNADQATRVFFKKFVEYIKSSPWFEGKYDTNPGSRLPARQGEVSFIKNVNVYSGHSQREAFEGYNLFAVVLDEIAAFALESAQGEVGKTAKGIYKMYRASVNSRFAMYGKYISLSFPRYKGDFMMQLYEGAVASKQVVKRKEVMKIDEDLPDGYEGNYITIEWDEDHIDAYTAPKIYALRRPTWDVNPTKTLDEAVSEFINDYADALGRLACMPPDAVDAFFKDRTKIEEAFSKVNGVDNETGAFNDNFEPDPEAQYFIHVDLAQKHDRCAVALAHVDKWVKLKDVAGKEREPSPVVKVDALRFWEPKKGSEVDFTEVQEYIVSLQTVKGFNLRLVTFDQWRSEDMRKYLNSIGIRSDLLSIKRDQYVDMAVIMNEKRLEGPMEPKLREELLQLMLLPNGKVDHPRQGYKDLSDATCGAIYNAIHRTPRSLTTEIEPMTLTDFRKAERNRLVERKDNVIVAPSRKEELPPELAAYLQSIKVL
jgi:hypothetical protein